MFQAVSLRGDADAAKVLAYSAQDLRRVCGVGGRGARVDGDRGPPLREAEGTIDEAERYRFGVAMMEREAIRVMTANDLARVAETAARELVV